MIKLDVKISSQQFDDAQFQNNELTDSIKPAT